VAVKTLLRFSPAALYRFKQEFRTLTDVVHPNLVHLYELVATDSDHVFFAMELVLGVDFLTYSLRPEATIKTPSSRPATTRLPTDCRTEPELDRTGPFDVASLVQAARPDLPSPADFERLRPALRQLVLGVNALHAAGKLHRDIKPSNVLVTPEGRVVLLDFGVATDLSRVQSESLGEREVVGTARYMAPEQATDGAPTVASDWYSVGAMLYEVLVGRPPFAGPSVEVLTRKSVVDAPPPSACVGEVPADLDTLCSALLRRLPASRPTGAEILRFLRDPLAPPSKPPLPGFGPPLGSALDAPFIGRQAELRALNAAFEAACQGKKLVTVRVHGSSGMGRSALLQHFVYGLVDAGEAVVLQGKAYERESMPYKALDSVIDALSRYLMRLSTQDPTMTLPRDISALTQLFPVLGRIPRVNEAGSPAAFGPTNIRRRAIAALRELLGELATRRPLVIYANDVQWGDVDSAGLLVGLARPPFDAPILVILAYRDEEQDSSPFLLETRARWPVGTEVRDIEMGPLAESDARTLALTFVAGDAAEETADSIAHESGGSPLIVEELARSVAGSPAGRRERVSAVRLERVMAARMSVLSASDRRLLELVAVSARPLPVSIVGDAAGVYDELDETISTLRAGRFVRTGFRDGREVVEMIHDRIRETVVDQLSVETLRAHHGRLARVLEPVPGVDTEALAVHLFGAGEKARAAQYAERAAEQAVTKLAFGQAIRLYRFQIDTLGDSSPDVGRARVRLAEVLERAEHGVEAAGVYQAAAERARGFERMELERKAAGQLLLAGHLDEGEAALGRVLEAAGMKRPRTLPGAVLWFLFYRLALFLTGSRLREREASDVRRADHVRIEALHAVVLGLALVNVAYGLCVQARHLFLALRAGDRFQVLRAAGIEALNAAARGGREGARERAFGEVVRRLADRIDEVDARAFHEGTRVIRMFLHGRWREAGDGLIELIEKYATAPAGWHSNAQLFAIYALCFRGKLAELRLHHAARLADAEERGDLYATVNLRIGHTNMVWLVADDVAAARRHVREAMAAWTRRGYLLQHYRGMLAEANIELYTGESSGRPYAIVDRDWSALRKSFLMTAQYVRADAHFLRARCALASIRGVANRQARIAEVIRLARALERERMAWTAPLAALVRAGAAAARGDRARAIVHMRSAVEKAEGADMLLHAAVARLRLGTLVGGAEGEILVHNARSWMSDQGIVRPERIAAMISPELE
jgi:eukaryotic-like serine/threonine-protein kinase